VQTPGHPLIDWGPLNFFSASRLSPIVFRAAAKKFQNQKFLLVVLEMLLGRIT
jgi:hypothetical protein